MLVLKAHAKLNLALAVAPPEPPGSLLGKPGWHRIASWMHAVELHDRLEFARLDAGQTTRVMRAWSPDAPRAGEFDWPLEKDLIVRAHQLMELRASRTLGVAIAMVKSIPAGGGLGGGSADAAAVMVGLNRLFELGFTGEQLRKFSQTLGSDVAFFIDDAGKPPRPAIVTGFGDRLERLSRTTGAAVLIFPEFGCPTPAVYKAYDVSPVPLREAEVRGLVKGRLPIEHPLFNDLTGPATRVEPRLSEVLARARELAGRPVHMSGSGSTLFAPAKDDADARSLAARLASQGLRVAATRLV